MELENKNIVITGASSGIGLSVLKELEKKSCKIIACSRKIESQNLDLKDAKAEIIYKNCDVSKKESIDELFDFAIKKFGHIDLFISNAGFAYYEKIDRADWEHIESIVDTNFNGFVYCLEKMKEEFGKAPYNFLVTASAMAELSIPGYSLYSGTKAAIRGFCDAYRYELEPGQNLQAVYPVATKTNFFKNAGNSVPVPWPTQDSETVALKIIRGIEKDRKNIYPSFVFRLTSIFNRIFPFILHSYADIYGMLFKKWVKNKDRND